MASLFIIGNGFDLAHGLKTSYEDFHQYLKYCYHITDENIYSVPGETMGNHGETIYDDDEVVNFLNSTISDAEYNGDNWSDVETTLGTLNVNKSSIFHSDSNL
jgi:hypothetical protein